MLSEDVASLISPDERFDSPGKEWFPQSQTSIQDLSQDYGQELISKGPPKAEVQLRYNALKNYLPLIIGEPLVTLKVSPFGHKWTISAPGVIINNPVATL